MRPTAKAAQDKALFGARTITPLVASALLNPLNSTLIAVALIPIGHSFEAGPAQTAWLISALYLATAVGQPVVGLLVDRFGPRRILLIGAGIVGLAGIAGIFPVSLGWLTGVRAVLGIGTCAGFPAAMAVLRRQAEATGDVVPARVLSILAISAQTIMVIGPTFGGALIGLFGWPAIFAVNLPLSVIAIVLTLLWIPRDEVRSGPTARGGIDFFGIVLFSLTLLALLLYVMEPGVRDLYLLALAVLLGAVFVIVELRVSRPFLNLRMLAGNTPMLGTYLRQALAFLVIYSVMFGYVQWLEYGRGLTESVAGAMLLPMSAVAVVAAAVSGRAASVRAQLIVSAAAALGGSVLLLFVDTGTWLISLLGIGAVFGLGQGLTSVSNQTALQRQAPTEHIGTASGLFRTAQYLGAIAASTLIALCYGQHATSARLHTLAIVLIGVSLALLAVTVFERGLQSPLLANQPNNTQNGDYEPEHTER